MASKSRRQLNWSALPSELLLEIAKSLGTRIDLLRLRAVCNSWRSSVPLPPKTLVLKLPFPLDPKNEPSILNGHYALTESTVYSLEPLTNNLDSKNPWFMKIKDSNSGKYKLLDPLSGLPGVHRKYDVPKVLNLLDYRVKEISSGYDLDLKLESKATSSSKTSLRKGGCLCCLMWASSIKQVVVSSSFHKIGGGVFAVMALDRVGSLAVWKMGYEKWTNIDDGREGSGYEYVSYHNGKFYAVHGDGLTITIDVASLKVTEVVPAKENRSRFGHGNKSKYMVHSFGDVFLIEKGHKDRFDGSKSAEFKIYKLDEEMGDWVKVDGLKDHALFISDDCVFVVLAKNIAGCKSNCIYFDDRPGLETRIFNF